MPTTQKESQPIAEETFNLDQYSWESVMPCYYNPQSCLFFGITDPSYTEARYIDFSRDIVPKFYSFLSIYPSIAAFYGNSLQIERLSKKYSMVLRDLSKAVHAVHCATCLINQAINAWAPKFCMGSSQWHKESNDPDMAYPLSAMMGWSIREAADYYIHDYAPRMSAPHPLARDPKALALIAADVRSYFSPFAELFSDEENPYTAIMDLQSLPRTTSGEHPGT